MLLRHLFCDPKGGIKHIGFWYRELLEQLVFEKGKNKKSLSLQDSTRYKKMCGEIKIILFVAFGLGSTIFLKCWKILNIPGGFNWQKMLRYVLCMNYLISFSKKPHKADTLILPGEKLRQGMPWLTCFKSTNSEAESPRIQIVQSTLLGTRLCCPCYMVWAALGIYEGLGKCHSRVGDPGSRPIDPRSLQFYK